MNIFKQHATADIPFIELNSVTGICIFKGRSIPKDAIKVYAPVFEWIKEYAKNPQTLTSIDFQLEYFNTGTSKILFEILLQFKALKSEKSDVQINWYYTKEDNDIKEIGVRFESLLEHSVNLIEYK